MLSEGCLLYKIWIGIDLDFVGQPALYQLIYRDRHRKSR